MPTQEKTHDAVDNASLERLVRENTAVTLEMREEVRGFRRILIGEPDIKRPGLVETVDFHRKLIFMGSGIAFVIYPAWELFKWFHPNHVP